MTNPNFYPPFQYTPPHVFHPPQSPNDFRQEVEGKLTQIMQSIEKMQQLLTGPPIPVMTNTDEESAHSKETSSNLVNQSYNMPTPVSLIDNLDNLSRDVKLTDVDSEDLKQLKVPKTAVDDPHMFDKSPEKIYVVQISPTPLDAPISVVSLVESTKRALSIGSNSELTLNDDKMVYKFHENEYGKVHEKLYRNFNNLANALQVLEKLPIKDKIVENNESDDTIGKLGKLQEDERDIEEQRATLSTAHSSPIDVADIKSGGVLQNDAINRNSGQIIAYAKTIIYAWQLNVKCAHLELVYLVKIQAPEQAALEGNYSIQILNQKLGLVVVDSCFFNMLWNTRKAEMKGIDVYIFLNCGSNSSDVTENNIYLDTEVDDLYWTLDYVKIQVLKVEVNQIIKVCNSQDKKWRLKILFIIAPKKLLTTFFHPTSSDKEFYLCALVGLIGATRLTLYHDLLDEGYFPTYEYQDVVHLLSYVYLICFSVMLVVALIIYAYWTTTLMGIFMKFDDLLETSSNHVGLTMFKFASVPQLICCKR